MMTPSTTDGGVEVRFSMAGPCCDMKVWHASFWHASENNGRLLTPVRLGYRTIFSKNAESMLRFQVSGDFNVTESSRNHTVFTFNTLEAYTYAKLIYAGSDFRQMVEDYVNNINKAMNHAGTD